MVPSIEWGSILHLHLQQKSKISIDMRVFEELEREKEGQKRYAPVESLESAHKKSKHQESSAELLPDFRAQEKAEAVFEMEVKEPERKRLKLEPSDAGVLLPFRKEEVIDRKRKSELELDSSKRRRTYEKLDEDPFDCSTLFRELEKLQ